MVRWQLAQLLSNLLQGEPDPLSEDDEGDPAQHGAVVAAVPGALSLGDDEALVLIEAESGRGDPAALGNFADGQD